MDVSAGCMTPPVVKHSSQKWHRNEDSVVVSCDIGYASPFGGQQLVIMCVNGSWENLAWPDPSEPSCMPVCSLGCGAGRCVAPNTCECPFGLNGTHCEISDGCSDPPLIPHHAKFIAGEAGSGKLTCEDGYSFLSNKSEISLVCIDGLWFAPGVEDDEENKAMEGERIKGDGIMCRKKLGEESMERSNVKRKDQYSPPPPVPHASLIRLQGNSSSTWVFEVVCFPGYSIPRTNFISIIIHLEDGVWTTAEELNIKYSDVSCELSCTDGKGMVGCQNGGTCVEGVCVCPHNSMGQFCETLRCSHHELPLLHDAYYSFLDEITAEGHPTLKIQCRQGFLFPDNSSVTYVKCFSGSWDFRERDMFQRCLPRCNIVCTPPLFCVAPDLCGCDRNANDGGTCNVTEERSLIKFPQIVNGVIVKRPNGTTYTRCNKGYQINNQTSLEILLFNDTWVMTGIPPAYVYDCKPKCNPACGNREECYKPNKCRCLPYFEGDKCQNVKPSEHSCPSQYPYIPYSDISKHGKLVCINGFRLSDHLNKTKLVCKNGQYEVQEGDGKCHPVCKPGCYNNGTCVAPNECQCARGFSGRRCQLTECPNQMHELLFATIVQCSKNGSSLQCQVGYKSPSGKEHLPIKCVDGKWQDGSDRPLLPCEPVCEPPCENGGKCIAPQTCYCPVAFSGKYCHVLKKCSALPTGLVNAKFWNKGDTGIAFCTDGYTFNSKSGAEENITCVDGRWDIMINGERRNEYVKLQPQNIGEMVLFQLGCLPLCNPPCLNGGTCVSHNLCVCPSDDHGSACHVHTCMCPLPRILHADYLYGDSMGIVKCKPGYKFSFGGDVITLTCHNTEWLVHNSASFVPPSCLPVCKHDCLNGGVCQEDGTCDCLPGFTGVLCELYVDGLCHDPPPTFNNSMLVLTNYKGTYTCLPGFRQANSSEESIQVECRNSSWVFPKYNNTVLLPDCVFWCQEGECGLDGVCLPTGKCVCTPYWTGERCTEQVLGVNCSELKLNHTIIKPINPDGKNLQVTCLEGYKMSSGMSVLNMTCVEGMWLSEQPTHNDDALGCQPVCHLPCINGGTCVAPDLCVCVEFFDGIDCSMLVYFSCKANIDIPANLKILKRNGSLVLRCESERPVGAGDVEVLLSCYFGQWMTPKDWSWTLTCAAEEGCTTPHVPRNAYIVENSSGSYVVCDEGFSLEGEKVVRLECIPEADAWALVMTGTYFVDDVECTMDKDEECDTDCGPNGVCARYRCVCDPGWTGRFCRIQLCTSTDFLVDNSRGVSFIQPGERVVVFCSANHRLPSGTSSVAVVCEEGSWMLSGSMNGHHRTKCMPVCDPPCHNLGKCIGHNVCECQFGFAGPRCTVCGNFPVLMLTTAGMRCIFPYTLNGKRYNDCFQADHNSQAWCPTLLNYISGEIHGAGLCLYDWGHKRTSLTYSGKSCKFPFLHKDSLWTSCVSIGNLSYCATRTDKDNKPLEYEQCASEEEFPSIMNNAGPSLAKLKVTTDGHICEFPFIYKGVEFDICVETEFERAWCATKVNVNREIQEYGICVDPDNMRKDITPRIHIDIEHYCRE